MAEKTLKGVNSLLAFSDGTAYLTIGCLTSNAISHTTDVVDGTPTKCDISPEPSYGASSYEINFDAVAVANNTTLASYAKMYEIYKTNKAAKLPTFWRITEVSEDAVPVTTIEYGKGLLLSLEKSAPAEGEITFSGSLRGIGEVSTTDLIGV